eukprot:6466871-Amphidinium_carterae.2
MCRTESPILYVSHSRDASALVWRQPFGLSAKSSGGIPSIVSIPSAVQRDQPRQTTTTTTIVTTTSTIA